jgi:omega-amidase
MKIFACQTNIVWEDKKANFKRVRQLLANTAIPPGSLIVLPEMFPTGFSMNVEATREDSPSETEAFLRTMAREFQCFVEGGLVSAGSDGHPRNQAVVFSPQGDLLARYSKIHPFSLGGETQHYTAGTELVTFDWNGTSVCPFVCYDLRFPEIFRAGVQRGAQVFTVIANWPVKRIQHWVTLLQARAIENLAYVIGVNRCGTDPKYLYTGRTMVVDPHGEIIAELKDEEAILESEILPEKVLSWRAEFPALRDMHWRP